MCRVADEAHKHTARNPPKTRFSATTLQKTSSSFLNSLDQTIHTKTAHVSACKPVELTHAPTHSNPTIVTPMCPTLTHVHGTDTPQIPKKKLQLTHSPEILNTAFLSRTKIAQLPKSSFPEDHYSIISRTDQFSHYQSPSTRLRHYGARCSSPFNNTVAHQFTTRTQRSFVATISPFPPKGGGGGGVTSGKPIPHYPCQRRHSQKHSQPNTPAHSMQEPNLLPEVSLFPSLVTTRHTSKTPPVAGGGGYRRTSGGYCEFYAVLFAHSHAQTHERVELSIIANFGFCTQHREIADSREKGLRNSGRIYLDTVSAARAVARGVQKCGLVCEFHQSICIDCVVRCSSGCPVPTSSRRLKLVKANDDDDRRHKTSGGMVVCLGVR